MEFEIIQASGNQTLFPFEYEGAFYYVRFVRRGSRLDCSGVFKFEVDEPGGRVVPYFYYQDKGKSNTQKVIKAAREYFANY